MQYDSKTHVYVPDKYISNTNSNAYISPKSLYFCLCLFPANTLRKSNVILLLYFGNLRNVSYFLLTLMARNLNYVGCVNVNSVT